VSADGGDGSGVVEPGRGGTQGKRRCFTTKITKDRKKAREEVLDRIDRMSGIARSAQRDYETGASGWLYCGIVVTSQ